MNVLILFGGRSAERDVSCISAAAILRALPAPYRPILVRIDPQGRWSHQAEPEAFSHHSRPFCFPFKRTPARLEIGASARLWVEGQGRRKVDVVFPALHGPLGEDGTLQGFLEMVGVPYVGSGVLGSAVGMDKAVTKRLAVQAGLPVLPHAVLEQSTFSKKQINPNVFSFSPYGGAGKVRGKLRYPVFVKPARLGSSVGVYKVHKPSELAAAVRRAFRFDSTVLVERGITAREIECAVLGGGGDVRASVVGEIRPNAEFYSYEAKYLDPNGAELLIPAQLDARRAGQIREMSVRAFNNLGCHGLARVDFLMDRATGKIWFNEVNTLPGFTAISMYPRLWEASGVPFPRLIDRLIRLALERHRRRSRLRLTRD